MYKTLKKIATIVNANLKYFMNTLNNILISFNCYQKCPCNYFFGYSVANQILHFLFQIEKYDIRELEYRSQLFYSLPQSVDYVILYPKFLDDT